MGHAAQEAAGSREIAMAAASTPATPRRRWRSHASAALRHIFIWTTSPLSVSWFALAFLQLESNLTDGSFSDFWRKKSSHANNLHSKQKGALLFWFPADPIPASTEKIVCLPPNRKKLKRFKFFHFYLLFPFPRRLDIFNKHTFT